MTGDRVVSGIINSDLVVADLTDLNPNAFYELVRSTGQCNTFCSLSAGVSKPKVFRGR